MVLRWGGRSAATATCFAGCGLVKPATLMGPRGRPFVSVIPCGHAANLSARQQPLQPPPLALDVWSLSAQFNHKTTHSIAKTQRAHGNSTFHSNKAPAMAPVSRIQKRFMSGPKCDQKVLLFIRVCRFQLPLSFALHTEYSVSLIIFPLSQVPFYRNNVMNWIS